MNVPQLRFSGFDGEWETKTLFELIESGIVIQHIDGNHGELYPKTDEFIEYGVPYVSANSLSNGKIDYSRVKYLSELRADKMKKGVSQPGDVLFAHNATVGPVGIVDKKFSKVILSTTLTLYRFNENLMNKFFVKSFMESDKYIQQYSNVMKQTTRNQVPITMQRSFSFPNIDIKEQNKVANFFNLIDQQIEKQEGKVEKLEQFKKGLMQKIFSQELRFKDENGKEFPKWEVKTINELAVSLDNRRRPLNTIDRQEMKGSIPYYGANGIVDFIDQYLFDEELILLAEDGGQFDEFADRPIAQYISGKSWVNNHAHILKTINCNNKMLFYLLVHKDIRKYINGTSRAKLNKESMLQIEVNIPRSLEEQMKIVKYLSAIDLKIKKEKEKLMVLEEQKKGFMQGMFV